MRRNFQTCQGTLLWWWGVQESNLLTGYSSADLFACAGSIPGAHTKCQTPNLKPLPGSGLSWPSAMFTPERRDGLV